MPKIAIEDYYPFGLTFNSYSRENGAPNMYQYNGKEKQDELDLGWLDYGARAYMADVGRWNRLDRLAEAFVALSPYHYAGNNPANFIDVNGDYFTGQTQYVDNVAAEARSSRDRENAKISELISSLGTALMAGDGEALASIESGINSAAEKRDGFQQTLDEIDELSASNQEYHISNGLSGTGAATSWDRASRAVRIDIAPDADNSLIAHELKHGYQFEVGKISFGAGPGGAANGHLLLDLEDEVHGYQRQALFNSGLLPTAVSENINVPNVRQIRASSGKYIYAMFPGRQVHQLPAIGDPVARDLAMKKISSTFNQAFRVNGKTYFPGVE